MSRPKRPSQPHEKNSIGLLIEKLSFLGNVDTMLLEGVSSADVAKYIQEEMGALADLDPKSLSNALRVRKKQREDTARSYAGSSRLPDPDDDDDDDDSGIGDDSEVKVEEPKVQKPSALAKSIYARAKGGIKDLLELEAMYLTQRDRIDRMVDLEHSRGIFAKDVGAEIMYAGQLIMMRVKTKHDLGLDDTSDTPMIDMRRYSEETVAVLSNPESRHRVMSLLQRLARLGKLKDAASEDEQIILPPPKTEE